MNFNNVINRLKLLDFEAKNGTENTYIKKYKNNILEIDIDEKNIKNSKIKYKDFGITVCRETTSNFSREENFVVLECINRLLEKGYKANNIVLEKDWGLGHTGKGYCDIQLIDDNNKSCFLIECKTIGEEFEKEKKKMERDGGQLFSYLQQEQESIAICLYTSNITEIVGGG